MGWSGGTQVFDNVVSSLKTTSICYEKQEHILWNLISELEDMDWDNLQESEYYDDPDILAIIMQIHPEWFEEDE